MTDLQSNVNESTNLIKKDDITNINDNDAIVCRYCFGEQKDLDSNLIYPCNCKTPICSICLEHHIDVNNKTKCEICTVKYVYTKEIIPLSCKTECRRLFCVWAQQYPYGSHTHVKISAILFIIFICIIIFFMVFNYFN
jgi:E3 ubiquitin-protein ligase DOA10